MLGSEPFRVNLPYSRKDYDDKLQRLNESACLDVYASGYGTASSDGKAGMILDDQCADPRD